MTPDSVTRYSIAGASGWKPSENGMWVLSSDVAALGEQCKKLEAACERLIRLYVPSGLANAERAALTEETPE